MKRPTAPYKINYGSTFTMVIQALSDEYEFGPNDWLST